MWKKGYRGFIETMGQPMLVVDTDGFIIEAINEKLVECSGYLRKQLEGKQLETLFYGDEQQLIDLKQKITTHKKNQDSQKYTIKTSEQKFLPVSLETRRSPGKKHKVFISLTLIKDDLLRDFIIDEETKSQIDVFKNLPHIDRLAILGQMSAAMLHELKSAIMCLHVSIDTSTEILEESEAFIHELTNQDVAIEPERKRRMLHKLKELPELKEELKENIKRLNDLVRSSLYFSSKADAIAKPANIDVVIENVLTMFKYSSNIAIAVEKKIPFGEVTIISQQELEQILLNLLLNAAQACGEDGSIALHFDFENEEFRITVKDNGTGVPPELWSKIFEPFITTKLSDQGTGLGLYLSRAIARRRGGDVRLLSSNEQGTVFLLYLPMQITHHKDNDQLLAH